VRKLTTVSELALAGGELRVEGARVANFDGITRVAELALLVLASVLLRTLLLLALLLASLATAVALTIPVIEGLRTTLCGIIIRSICP
jgi:hypothetical protein